MATTDFPPFSLKTIQPPFQNLSPSPPLGDWCVRYLFWMLTLISRKRADHSVRVAIGTFAKRAHKQRIRLQRCNRLHRRFNQMVFPYSVISYFHKFWRLRFWVIYYVINQIRKNQSFFKRKKWSKIIYISEFLTLVIMHCIGALPITKNSQIDTMDCRGKWNLKRVSSWLK